MGQYNKDKDAMIVQHGECNKDGAAGTRCGDWWIGKARGVRLMNGHANKERGR